MNRNRGRSFRDFRCLLVSLIILSAVSATPAQQEQTPPQGIVTDWSSHHVVFSNPGTVREAMAKGKLDEWSQIVNEPRYRMQQIRRGVPIDATGLRIPLASDSPDNRPIDPGPDNSPLVRLRPHGDWSVTVSATNGQSTAVDMYPAKYSFSPISAPDCVNDFVVFPVLGAGSATHQNLIGMNNLYNVTCTGTVPTVLFAYFVGTGQMRTSPVLSLDGSKIAIVESIANGSRFHVIKIDKSGNAGCPNATPCNGNAYNRPAVPGTHNSAVDTRITLSGNVTLTISSPFVDYKNDIAYVGDNTGKLHKITGVFNGTPAEAAAPWPVTVAAGATLTGPVVDPGASKNIFVGASNGNLYCITAAGAACATASISVAAGTTPGAVVDVPIVDATTQKVFAAASNSTTSVLTQATTSLGSPVRAAMGVSGTDLYDGTFDSGYYTSVSTGHMYFCGNLTTAATPTLWRVTFNSSGTMSSTNDGNSFQLVRTGNTGTGSDCTPLTEVLNTGQGKDYLFLAVKNHGFNTGTPNCANLTCLMAFVLPASTFPTKPNATVNTTLGTRGISGIVVDNVSTAAGASQIYFGNLQANTAVQGSQAALQ